MAFRSTIFLVAALAMGTPLLADSTVQPATTATAKPAIPDGERIVCEDIEQIGSRLNSHRVCLTKNQWRAQRNSDRDLIDKSQREVGTQPAG